MRLYDTTQTIIKGFFQNFRLIKHFKGNINNNLSFYTFLLQRITSDLIISLTTFALL